MPNAQFIVCEKRGNWATALRRAIEDDLRVCETRSLAECRERLAACPDSFLVLELRKDNIDAVLEMFVWLRREHPGARAAVVGCRDGMRWEMLVREAGAIIVQFSPRRMQPVIRTARRHLEALDKQEKTLEQTIMDRLPWGGSMGDKNG